MSNYSSIPRCTREKDTTYRNIQSLDTVPQVGAETQLKHQQYKYDKPAAKH